MTGRSQDSACASSTKLCGRDQRGDAVRTVVVSLGNTVGVEWGNNVVGLS